MSSKEFTNMALSFPGTVSHPHFDRTAFKVLTKRIFATLHEQSESANIMLSPAEQAIFCSMDKGIYPVPNKWGVNGATTFEVGKIDRSIILDALDSAYKEVFKIKKRNK